MFRAGISISLLGIAVLTVFAVDSFTNYPTFEQQYISFVIHLLLAALLALLLTVALHWPRWGGWASILTGLLLWWLPLAAIPIIAAGLCFVAARLAPTPKKTPVIYLGADHAGWPLKERLRAYLEKKGLAVTDLGNAKFDRDDDYPDFARPVAEATAQNKNHRGILICGSGIGMCIAANKVRGVRAFIPLNPTHAEYSRRHTATNVICLGGHFTPFRTARRLIDRWLATDFEPLVRHRRRLAKIE